MDQMEVAIAELRICEGKNIAKVARGHGIIRSTLSRRYHGKTVSRSDAHENQRNLDAAQSAALLSYIKSLTERGLPPTIEMLRNIAAEIIGYMLGKN
ncbi:uncharacterized protein BDZ99DRAFT_463947 [Mytilinidion resinicola]|uniref:HTH psq-type domain-containing protein n=1 Tax=Mytilinidion resinicola TaxID=574789 RepID=A0A6A6YJW0_9PEZI|nr:uncharacterized protein BDZ99DRAFT_463947 [Mytilinidion resinicola]KAF2809142.1 hypothetical protein BDZ99DRAFT_463947 [Mytilinidion resinicola]